MAEQVQQVERSAKVSGRRGLIAGAALAAAGLAKAVTPGKAEANDNGALLLGNSNTAQSATWISRDTAGDGAGTNCLIAISNDTNGNGFLGYGKGSGTAVAGFALGNGLGM